MFLTRKHLSRRSVLRGALGVTIGLPLLDASSGGCRDGLHHDRVNENQGAESTLAFQIALAEMTAAHHLPIPLAS